MIEKKQEPYPPNATLDEKLHAGLRVASRLFISSFSQPFLSRGYGTPSREYLNGLDGSMASIALFGHALAIGQKPIQKNETLTWVEPARQSVKEVANQEHLGRLHDLRVFSPTQHEIQREIFLDMCQRRVFVGFVVIRHDLSYRELVADGHVGIALDTIANSNS